MHDKLPADGIRNLSIMYNASMKSFQSTNNPVIMLRYCYVFSYNKTQLRG